MARPISVSMFKYHRWVIGRSIERGRETVNWEREREREGERERERERREERNVLTWVIMIIFINITTLHLMQAKLINITECLV